MTNDRYPGAVDLSHKFGQPILLVDDHSTNRDVIQRQLSTIGLISDKASNGAEALEKWRNKTYALVLCDCNMPVMDGFTLAMAIREAEALTGVYTPIIALTANALSGEYDRCREAGMDDYLAKPVGLDSLSRTIGKWVQFEGAAKGPQRTSSMRSKGAVTDARPKCPFDLRRWREIDGECDLDLLQSAVDDFKIQLAETHLELRLSFEANDLKGIVDTAHRGRGAASLVAARDLSLSFEKLEVAVRDGRTDDLGSLIMRLEFEIGRVQTYGSVKNVS